jgi:hypothetical protein
LVISSAVRNISATIKKLLSVKNVLWTDENNSFLVETTEAMVVARKCFGDSSGYGVHPLV